MSGINLGNVVGLLVSDTAPTKKYVIWAKPNPSNDDDYTLFKYDAIASEWKPYDVDRSYFLPAVIALGTNTLPSSPSLEDAYLIGDTPTGIAVGHAQEHALWNGYAWIFIEPKEGASCRSKTDPNATYVFNSGEWVLSSISVTGYVPTTGTVTGYDISGDLVTEDSTLVKFGRDFTATGGSQGSWFEVQHGGGSGNIGMYSRGLGLGFTAGITVNYSGGVFLDAYNSTITANNQLKLYSNAGDLWLSSATDIVMFGKNLKLPTRATADRSTGNGYIAYNTDTNQFEGYKNGAWGNFFIGDALAISGGTLTGFLTLHADPTSAMHAVTKNYVDNLLTGITWKEKVRVATLSNITLSGTQTIDTVTVSVGDRVLVKNQTTQTENGIYIVSSSAWTRSEDANTGAEILTAAVLITAGSQGNTQWTCSNSTTPTIGSTNITFAQIAGAGVYTSGTGITLTGNVFAVDLTRVATSSVTGLLSASDWSVFNNKLGATAVTTEVWNTNANYTVTNTTAKILVIEQDGTLTAPRTLTLSTLPSGSIVVIRGGASITATNTVSIGSFVNGASSYANALTLAYQSLTLYSLGGGFYSTNKPQFSETTTEIFTSKILRGNILGTDAQDGFPTLPTAGDMKNVRLNSFAYGVAMNMRGAGTRFIKAFDAADGYSQYASANSNPNILHWNGDIVQSGTEPTGAGGNIATNYAGWWEYKIFDSVGRSIRGYFFRNTSGVPSNLQPKQEETSGLSIAITGSPARVVVTNTNEIYGRVRPLQTTTALTKMPELNRKWSNDGTVEYWVGDYALGSAAIDASAQLELQSTSKGILLNRLSTAQRLAIASPATSLLMYDTNLNQFAYYVSGTASSETSWAKIVAPDYHNYIFCPISYAVASGPLYRVVATGTQGSTNGSGYAAYPNIDPYIVDEACTLYAIGVRVVQAAVSQGTAGASPTVRLDVYRNLNASRSLVGTFRVVITGGGVGVSSTLATITTPDAYFELGGLTTSLAKGESIGVEFVTENVDNNKIVSVTNLQAILKTKRDS